jgi:hypothetical protein
MSNITNNTNMPHITNNTNMPQDSNLIKFVVRAVNKHFSKILDIGTLEEKTDEGETYLIIRLKNNESAYLKIDYIYNPYSPIHAGYGSVSSGYEPTIFKTYGQLKDAIRNGILQMRDKSNRFSRSNNNIDNNFVMSGGNMNKYLQYKKKYLNLKYGGIL